MSREVGGEGAVSVEGSRVSFWLASAIREESSRADLCFSPPLAAVPHPQVPDDKLYRSTDGSEPLARRLRSIFSWTAQRQRDKVFASSAPSDPTQAFAKEIVDSFITDICESRLDVSVPYKVSWSDRRSGMSAGRRADLSLSCKAGIRGHYWSSTTASPKREQRSQDD